MKHQTATLLLLAVLLPTVLTAPLNLNLKSSFLSNLLSKQEPQAKANAETKKETEKSSLVSLDLSGEYECLVVGSISLDEDVDHQQPQALIQRREGSSPDVAVGFHYNFDRAWYGATRLFTSLRWNNEKGGVDFRTEKSISQEDDDEYAAEIGIDWKECSLLLRADSLGRAKASVQLPLHRRLGVALSNAFLRGDRPIGHFNSKVPRRHQDWWMPNLHLGPTGILSSRNEVGVQRYGMRLMWSRSVGWSMFGTEGGDSDTRLRLEVDTLGDAGQTCTSVRIDTVLEQMLESARWTLTHERVSTWG